MAGGAIIRNHQTGSVSCSKCADRVDQAESRMVDANQRHKGHLSYACPDHPSETTGPETESNVKAGARPFKPDSREKLFPEQGHDPTSGRPNYASRQSVPCVVLSIARAAGNGPRVCRALRRWSARPAIASPTECPQGICISRGRLILTIESSCFSSYAITKRGRARNILWNASSLLTSVSSARS